MVGGNSIKTRKETIDAQPLVEAWKSFKSSESNPLDADELASIEALVLHVATTSGQPAFRIERQVADHFAVPNLKCLPDAMYSAALEFMMSMLPAESAA
jgi:hypothetical protein